MKARIAVIRQADGQHYAALTVVEQGVEPYKRDEVFSLQGVGAIAFIRRAKEEARARGIGHVIGID